MNSCFRWLAMFFIFASLRCLACGDNENLIVQGPFNDSEFKNGYICFQHSSDKRDIAFYLSYKSKGVEHNEVMDTYEYSDGPVELMSVFFAPVHQKRNLVVLLRWHVNYENNGIRYLYFYEIKTYQKRKNGYELNLKSDSDSKLSGYQTQKKGKVTDYPLNNAERIKNYLINTY